MARSRGRTILGGSGAGASRPTATGGSPGSIASSPMSMGELITQAEQRLVRNVAHDLKYNKGSATKSALKAGVKLGERMVLGRTYYGYIKGGSRAGSHIANGIIRMSRMDPSKLSWIIRVRAGPRELKYPPQYTVNRDCGRPATGVSGTSGHNNCLPGKVVFPGALGEATSGTIVYGWYDTGVPYGQTGANVMDPSFRLDRSPLNPPDYPVSVYKRPIYIPGSSRDVTYGRPMGFAPGLNWPASAFTQAEPETFTGTSAPWKTQGGLGGGTSSLGGTSAGDQTQTTTPNGATQTITVPGDKPGPGTDTTTKPGTHTGSGGSVGGPGTVVTRPGAPLSRPPGKGTKETKFAGKAVLVRVLKLGLGITEGVDAIKAIADAIPKPQLDRCKQAAKQRYYNNRNNNATWGTVNWKMSPQEMTICIYNNLEHLEFNHVFYNLVKNQIEDLWIGWQIGLIDRELQISRDKGGPTSLKQPWDPVPAQLPSWDDPFWDEVAAYLKDRGL